MKRMKCESCGANLEVKEDSDYATCPYCKVKYKIGDNKNINININDNSKEVMNNGINSAKKVSIIVIILIVAVPIIIFSIIFIFAFGMFKQTKVSNGNGPGIINNIIDYAKEKQEDSDKDSFNYSFEKYSGTESKFFINNLLDKVVTNNKKNSNRLITVIYNDKKTTDPDEIVSIKHLLDDNNEYEVKLDYDEKGYVNKITLLDL